MAALKKKAGKDVLPRPASNSAALVYFVQAARIGWPMVTGESAPLLGMNFCCRPPRISTLESLPSWFTPLKKFVRSQVGSRKLHFI